LNVEKYRDRILVCCGDIAVEVIERSKYVEVFIRYKTVSDTSTLRFVYPFVTFEGLKYAKLELVNKVGQVE